MNACAQRRKGKTHTHRDTTVTHREPIPHDKDTHNDRNGDKHVNALLKNTTQRHEEQTHTSTGAEANAHIHRTRRRQTYAHQIVTRERHTLQHAAHTGLRLKRD